MAHTSKHFVCDIGGAIDLEPGMINKTPYLLIRERFGAPESSTSQGSWGQTVKR